VESGRDTGNVDSSFDRSCDVVLSLDGGTIRQVSFEDTEHYRITKDFLDAPERFYRHLFTEDDSGS